MAGKTFAEFEETITLEMPRIDNKILRFSESEKGSRGLIVEVAAIHAGITSNFNYYSAAELENSVNSWISPYPKPIIVNHDLSTDPVGRVMAAKMDVEEDGTVFTRLQVAVTDPAAIEKLVDQRYLTGSVGGKSEQALCSVCNKDWAEASAFGPTPCRHVRGKTYKGSLAYLNRQNCSFKEYSFVNAPADGRSQVRSLGDSAQTTTEGWVTPARFFDLNMDKEEILEYTESEDRDVLSGMKRREASPLYLSLKGAFLSSLAESEKFKESTVDEDDVLAVTRGLSEDLAQADEETPETPDGDGVVVTDADTETPDDEVEVPTDEEAEADAGEHVAEDGTAGVSVSDVSAAQDGTSTERDEADETLDEEADETSEVTEEYDWRTSRPTGKRVSNQPGGDKGPNPPRPQGGERTHRNDLELPGKARFNKPQVPSPRPNPVKGADRTREADEDHENDGEVNGYLETDLEDYMLGLERHVEEVETREQALTEENARLKKALHQVLAERVVDTKITLGIADPSARAELLETHMERSAASLADSIRDLAQQQKLPGRPNYQNMPEMLEGSMAVKDDNKAAVVDDAELMTELDPESFMVDVFMGRRALPPTRRAN